MVMRLSDCSNLLAQELRNVTDQCAWGEVTVECSLLATDADSNVVVSLATDARSLDSQILTSHLHLTVHPSAIDSNMAEQIKSIALPFYYSQTVSDPSILYLLQLLQTEMQAPQPISQLLVSSIVTVLTTHLLQNF
jgi:hypothetical protein